MAGAGRTDSGLRCAPRFHVAIDARPLCESRPTGVARAFAAQLRAMLDLDPTLEVTAFAPRSPGPLGEALALEWEIVPSRFRRSLGALIEAVRPDVFFSPFIAVPRLARVPAVSTLHEVPRLGDVRYEGVGRTVRHRAWWAIARRRVAGAIAVSQYTADLAHRAGFRRPIAVVPHGVEPVPPAYDRAPDAPILVVGTVRRKKGVRLAIAAHARLRERGIDRELVWLGEGGERRGAGACVVFRGWVDDAVVHAELERAACLLVPSVTEGFGLPVLEAMVRGCPVIVSDAGALPEVVGETGTIVSSRSPAAWADAIANVLRSSAATRARARAAVERARAFRWETSGASVRAFLERIVRGDHLPGAPSVPSSSSVSSSAS